MPDGFFNGLVTVIARDFIGKHSYELDTLSTQARAQLQSLQFVDAELVRLQAQAAVLQTARMAYLCLLKKK